MVSESNQLFDGGEESMQFVPEFATIEGVKGILAITGNAYMGGVKSEVS